MFFLKDAWALFLRDVASTVLKIPGLSDIGADLAMRGLIAGQNAT